MGHTNTTSLGSPTFTQEPSDGRNPCKGPPRVRYSQTRSMGNTRVRAQAPRTTRRRKGATTRDKGETARISSKNIPPTGQSTKGNVPAGRSRNGTRKQPPGSIRQVWAGPYQIAVKHSPLIYEVDRNGRQFRYHVDQIRPAPTGNPAQPADDSSSDDKDDADSSDHEESTDTAKSDAESPADHDERPEDNQAQRADESSQSRIQQSEGTDRPAGIDVDHGPSTSGKSAGRPQSPIRITITRPAWINKEARAHPTVIYYRRDPSRNNNNNSSAASETRVTDARLPLQRRTTQGSEDASREADAMKTGSARTQSHFRNE